MSDPRLLVLDLCLGACMTAVRTSAGDVSEQIFLERGHQESLAPQVEALLARVGLRPIELSRIGVTVGPGSFTGVRVGLAFAKCLASALGIGCVGVSSLEALAQDTPQPRGVTLAAIPSRGEQWFCQGFRDGQAVTAPDLGEPGDLIAKWQELLHGEPGVVIGPEAERLVAALGWGAAIPLAAPTPRSVLDLCAGQPEALARPRPLYLRAPDVRAPNPHKRAIQGTHG